MSFRSRLRWTYRRSLKRMGFGPSYGRGDYRRVWESVSDLEADAKVSVSGSADEAGLIASAHVTVERLQATVGIQPTDTVLEIGAGVGRVGALMAPMCHMWIGADVAPNMLRHMERRLAHLPNVRTLLINGHDLSQVATATVDLVYCTVVFMHLDEWDRYSYVREAHRVLVPGGRLYVDNVSLVSEGGWTFFQKTADDYSPRERPPHISRISTPEELFTYLARAGFGSIGQRTWDDLWIATFGTKVQPRA